VRAFHSTLFPTILGAIALGLGTGEFASRADEPGERSSFRAEQREWWSFQPVSRPALPQVTDSAWVRNPIDAFVLAGLEAKGLGPSGAADRRTLIRRVTLDLIGLPPTPAEVEAFLADDSCDAFERVVDRLLMSPQYGERWARLWLDLARYAESDGLKSDDTRPNAWRYRDYVIQSLNDDKPYDRFIREQIAGDEINPHNAEALVATGFNRHWPDENNARNLVLRRQEILNDITDTTASVFLGLSLGCARCHDHKYDPITQKDYYRFQAFFAATQPIDAPAGSRDEREAMRDRAHEWEELTASIRAEMSAIEAPVMSRMRKDSIDKFVVEVREALAVDPAQRTPLEKQLAGLAETHMEITTDAMVNKMPKDDRDRWTKLRDSLKEFDKLKPRMPMAMVLTDVGREAPKTYVLRRGLYNAPEDEVEPGVLSYFDTDAAKIADRPESASTTGRRTALADWLASPANPLTSRVMVNRMWQSHFGRGLVGTPSDFGLQGERPTHPELLDWLADQFVQAGWRLKAIHRLMVTSNTYRQASAMKQTPSSNDAAAVDPDNALFWRMNRQRLDAELIRDAMLAVSGQLNPQSGGPSIHPELPAGLSDRYGWKPSADEEQRNRRSVYVFVRRNLRYPLFELFDMPDTNETCGRRNRTTTPPQALFVLNSELILNEARVLAGRIVAEAGPEPYPAVIHAYRTAFGRDASGDEIELAVEFIKRQAELVRARGAAASELALPNPMPHGMDAATGAAITDFCHALLNANEFIYVD